MAESMDTSEVILPDEDDRKLFVGGLPQVFQQDNAATYSDYSILGQIIHKFSFLTHVAYHLCLQDAKQDDISAHFQSFGELDNINLKTDPATGRSRQGTTLALDS